MFNGKTTLIPGLTGLVVCGGNSSRMGMDKSMLVYQLKPEAYRLYEMLENFCETVLISCNEKQAAGFDTGYKCLTDLPFYVNKGPMAGLLSAFTTLPGKNILFIGCDYPFLDAESLESFAKFASKENIPAAFFNKKEHIYEPLLAFYPYQAFDQLKEMYKIAQLSLQYFLNYANARQYIPVNEKCMVSVDTYPGYIKTKMYFESNTSS